MKYIKKGDKLDRYREHLITGKELPPKYQAYFEKLEYTNSLLCAGYSDGDVANILKNSKKYSDIIQGYGIIRDVKEIWGDVKKASKEGSRHVMYECFMRIARACEKNGDLDGASRNYEKASKLYDLFREDETPIDMSLLTRPTVIYFSTDPALLRTETEDADFEEVKGESE